MFNATKNISTYGLAGNDTLSSGTGDDLMVGGVGDDTYELLSGEDTIIERAGEGTDSIMLQFTSPIQVFSLAAYANFENLKAEGYQPVQLTGNALSNVIESGSGADTLRGGVGNDTIIAAFGNDQLFGGDGDDWLDGGDAILDRGADSMTGGDGADVFQFTAVADSTPAATDVILDFSQADGDRIGLLLIDAVTGGNNDRFDFVKGAAFTALGQLRVVNEGVNTFVEANTIGDLAADLRIQLNGVFALKAADFIL